MASTTDGARGHGRGPLPTLAEIEAIGSATGEVGTQVEDVVWRAGKVATAIDEDTAENPASYPTAAELGTLAMFADWIETDAARMKDLAGQLRGAMHTMSAAGPIELWDLARRRREDEGADDA